MAKKSKTAPRRRPKEGGYARGEETRAHIVETALRVFGEYGFDHASTRDIATKAGVTPPALQYYFDSKEGLHQACAKYIVDRALPSLAIAIQSANAATTAGDEASALNALEKLLDALTDSLADPRTDGWSRFTIRGKHDGGGPGMEMIRQRLSFPIIDAVTGLVGAISGTSACDEVTRLRGLLVLGQIHWIHSGREQALKVMGWPKLDSSKVSLIKQLVREHTRRLLADL